MFIRSLAAIALVLPALSGAINILSNNGAVGSTDGVQPTTGTQDPTTIGHCNTGTLQCCDQVQSADFSFIATLLGPLAGIVIGPNTLVGTKCSPITVVGTAGSSCATQPVCCTNNKINGVALDCQTINS